MKHTTATTTAAAVAAVALTLAAADTFGPLGYAAALLTIAAAFAVAFKTEEVR